jgi:hypothetical protein
MPYYPTRKLTIFALDPSVCDKSGALRTQIEIPNEELEAGPRGYRVQLIDYDSSSGALYQAAPIPKGVNSSDGPPLDPYGNAKLSDAALVADPHFHAFMTYGVVMKTLARFEFALGRRVGWSFNGHQIQVAPHAFADANAFYTKPAQALMFGYFPLPQGGRAYTCLSHEIVAHETTHALLDGLRSRYTAPSSPQQAGFHEGFADIVALLSVLSAPEVVARAIDLKASKAKIARNRVRPSELRRNNPLLGLAQQVGGALSGVHGQALRRSVELKPRTDYLATHSGGEAHRCGEVLVAAVLNAYLDIWIDRLEAIGDRRSLDRARAAEEGAEIANTLLTACIRAIDYCPPTDLQFGDFASAALTADFELHPSDTKYRLRDRLFESFLKYGIAPSSPRETGQRGAWNPLQPEDNARLRYDRTHAESLRIDRDEVFRFIWENRHALRLNEQALTRVLSVRPCVRTALDGFILRETVVEYHQQLKITASELREYQIDAPKGMPPSTVVTLYGGSALIFDEYGRLKYSIGNSIFDPTRENTLRRQTERLEYLWESGYYDKGAGKLNAFARMHRLRSADWFSSLRPADAEQERK